MKSLEDCLNKHTGIKGSLARAIPGLDVSTIKNNPDILLKEDVLEKLVNKIYEHFDVDKEVNLSEWDRQFIPVLYGLRKGFITDQGISEDEKVKLLLESENNLFENLKDISPWLDLKSYNEQILKKLDNLGINTNNWLDGNYNFTTHMNNGERITFEQWSRDFKKEFSIGHYSDCCIALGGDDRGDIYQEVLLDYFIDHSINVIKISNENREIGQLYFVALTDKDFNTVLGTTSVEIDKEYGADEELAKVIAERISEGRSSIKEYFGFDKAVMSKRYSGFNDFIYKSGDYLSKSHQSLRARRNKLRNRKKSLIERPSTMNNKRKFITLKNQINQATIYLKSLEDEKINFSDKYTCLNRLTSNTNYQGTDYLDLFNGKFLHNKDTNIGFYDLDNLSFKRLDLLKEEIRQYKANTK